jgi:hypothetical protein
MRRVIRKRALEELVELLFQSTVNIQCRVILVSNSLHDTLDLYLIGLKRGLRVGTVVNNGLLNPACDVNRPSNFSPFENALTREFWLVV